jgi:hypothetical protein
MPASAILAAAARATPSAMVIGCKTHHLSLSGQGPTPDQSPIIVKDKS